MNEFTNKVYAILKNDSNMSSKTNGILAIVGVAFILFGVIASVINEGLMVLGVFVGTILLLVILFRWLYVVDCRRFLKKSLKTLLATGNIKYIDEITKRKYTTIGKAGFSEHLFYLPGKTALAYTDIINVFRVKADYVLVTIDGVSHRVRISKDVLNKLFERNNQIGNNLPYKEYKHKIQQFKANATR